MSDVTHMSSGKSGAECEAALDYLYGMLDGQDKARFEAHLTGCASCQAELEGMGRVRTVAREVHPLVEPGDRLTGALHAQLMHAAAQRKQKGKVLSFARRIVSHPGYAAAASLLIIGGVLGLQWSRGALLMPPKQADVTVAAPVVSSAAPTATPTLVPTEAPSVEAALKETPEKSAEQPKGATAVGATTGSATIDGKLAKGAGDVPPASKDQPFAVTTAMPKQDPQAPGHARGLTDNANVSELDARDKKSGAEKLAQGDDDLAKAKEGISKPDTGSYWREQDRSRNQAPTPKAPPSPVVAENKPADSRGPRIQDPVATSRPSAQASAPATVPPPAPSPRAPAKPSRMDSDGSFDDAQQRGSTVQRRMNADEAPAQTSPSADKNLRGGDNGSNAALGNAQGGGRAGYAAPSEQEERNRETVKAESNTKTPADPFDAERTRAGQLAQQGHCDEAAQVYEGLERRAPERMTSQDRLTYTRCLRTLGRLEPAQGELDQLRNNRQNAPLPAAAINAEQKAIDVERKRQVAEPNYAMPAERHAAPSKAKKNKAAPADAYAPAPAQRESGGKADTKRAF